MIQKKNIILKYWRRNGCTVVEVPEVPVLPEYLHDHRDEWGLAGQSEWLKELSQCLVNPTQSWKFYTTNTGFPQTTVFLLINGDAKKSVCILN